MLALPSVYIERLFLLTQLHLCTQGFFCQFPGQTPFSRHSESQWRAECQLIHASATQRVCSFIFLWKLSEAILCFKENLGCLIGHFRNHPIQWVGLSFEFVVIACWELSRAEESCPLAPILGVRLFFLASSSVSLIWGDIQINVVKRERTWQGFFRVTRHHFLLNHHLGRCPLLMISINTPWHLAECTPQAVRLQYPRSLEILQVRSYEQSNKGTGMHVLSLIAHWLPDKEHVRDC